MNKLSPGEDGDPLPANLLVFRIGKGVKLSPEALRNRRAMTLMFEPSTQDKNSPRKGISIWAEELTVADQAWAIMGAKPDNTVVACLQTSAIESIVPPAGFQGLKCFWEECERLPNGEKNSHPGSAGHAGISGLVQGGKGKQDSEKRKVLRSTLAANAELSPVPVPHNLESDRIANAAYFIAMKHAECDCGDDAHWMLGVQQIRRETVRASRAQST